MPIKTRNVVIVGFSLLLLLLIPLPFLYTNSYVRADYLGDEVIYETVVHRRIRLNNIEVVLLSFNWKRLFTVSSKNFSWVDLNGTPRTADLFIYSSPIRYHDDYVFLEPDEYGIAKSKLFNASLVQSGRKLGYSFIVNYTGKYYRETIIFGYGVTYEISLAFNWKEVNRTEFVSHNESQRYNPSVVIYKAASLLIHYKYPFKYIHDILLIPRTLLNSTFREHEFIWVISFSDYPYDFLSPLKKLTPELNLNTSRHRIIHLNRYIFYFDENNVLLAFAIRHEFYVTWGAEY